MGRKLNIIKITPETRKQYNEISKRAKELTDREVASATKGLYEHFDKDFKIHRNGKCVIYVDGIGLVSLDVGNIEALRKKIRKSKLPKCFRLTLWQKIKYSKIWNYIKNVIRMFN